MIAGLVDTIRFIFSKYKWKRQNTYNGTSMVNNFPINLVKIGKNTYGGICCLAFSNDYKCRIGNYCSIGPETTFVLSAEHRIDTISTFPFKVKILNEKMEGVSKGDIIVEDDVWIGARATILSGVRIGQGAVIAAGAVVTSDIPPYAIVAGVPAKVIRYRFSNEIIEELLNVDYSRLEKSDIEQHIDLLYSELVDLEQLRWMPKKRKQI